MPSLCFELEYGLSLDSTPHFCLYFIDLIKVAFHAGQEQEKQVKLSKNMQRKLRRLQVRA